jgi:hypothetical protein
MRHLFAIMIAAVLFATSCEPRTNPTEDDAYHFNYLSGFYYGPDIATYNSYCYGLVMSNTENAYNMITGNVQMPRGSQTLYLELFTAEPSENLNISFAIPEGTYTLESQLYGLPNTISSSYTYLCIVDKSGSTRNVYFESGTVTVHRNTIEARLWDISGEEHHIVCRTSKVDNTFAFGANAMEGTFSSLTGDLNIAYTQPSTFDGESYGDVYMIDKNNVTMWFWWIMHPN